MTESDTRDGTSFDPVAHRSNCGVGAVMDLEGEPRHEIVDDALELLANLEHRGTTGADDDTGDGAGILIQIPHEFFAERVPQSLPDQYAVGSFFLPSDETVRQACMKHVEERLDAFDLRVIHWREVPTVADEIGEQARETAPASYQCVVTSIEDRSSEAFERTLYVARRAIETTVEDVVDGTDRFYVCSLDAKTIVYKGLLTATQLPAYYPDLRDDRLTSTFALVHARFSTNTLGAWHLAHPYRNVVHNGEFNTIQGNVNWMRAREADLESDVLGDDLETVLPVVADPDQSDTATLDNAVEFLLQNGRSLPHALRMLVPEAWHDDDRMDGDRRAWYDYHASLVEPWDGPALVVGTDGERIGAVLDRNGLRPCRYDVTTDETLIVASEAGALEREPGEVTRHGRLKPGQLFLADPDAGDIVDEDAVFEELTDDAYGQWVDDEQEQLDTSTVEEKESPVDDLRSHQVIHGYTYDELEHLLEPMAHEAKDPIGSMGDDTPLSALSGFNRPLSSYFKQRFAQVTNPAIDHIREERVSSLESRLGRQRNLLDESPEHARQLVLDSPILSPTQFRALDEDSGTTLSQVTIDITYDPESSLESAIERVRDEAREAVANGVELLTLSDRRTGENQLPIPALLATGAVHHHLVREGVRARTGLLIDSGAPRTVHQVATLVGYGAGAVHPYLAYQTITDAVTESVDAYASEAVDQYVEALEDGLLKTMSKMGISTFQSYQGAQIFEAVGLGSDFVTEYFTGTPNRTDGIGLDEVEADLRDRHTTAYGESNSGAEPDMERQGLFENRSYGVHHQWNPRTVSKLQEAVRENDAETYGEFAAETNQQTTTLQTLRGLLEFNSSRESIPLDEVEPVESIVQRFSTAPMSLGSISPEAHETNAIAMNRLGAKSNTGEGGEPPERFDTERGCSVKQVASGRFGVTSAYLESAEEIQIKIAQGAKPGEGGHLPGHKVNEMIASVRYTVPGVDLISPPPQHDIYSIEDLKQLIYDLKSTNPDADINVKLVAEAGIGPIAAGVAQAHADTIHVSGHAGGTGASPKTSIKNAGVPWELGLTEANRVLHETGLRDRVRLSTDGGLKTGRDAAVAALLGAEEYVFGTASLVSSGCVMARICHTNNCPTGVATQKPELRERFDGHPDYSINYFTFIAEELREIMADLGFRTLDGMIGRVDCLEQRDVPDHPRANCLDLSTVLESPTSEENLEGRKTRSQDHEVDEHFDRSLLDEVGDAVETGESVSINCRASNADRAIGTLLSNRISAEHGEDGLRDDTISVSIDGTVGQSFGAFLAPGVTLGLVGTANDYVGKGLSGGRICVRTPEDAAYRTGENISVGNVALYGATRGELFVNGSAGERFGVRNSGAHSVVEGVGDHGCEYMTGGVVVVLGPTGTNFAAGMSGGIAYVYDPNRELDQNLNDRMVSLSYDLSEDDVRTVRRLLERHREHTGSERANRVLSEDTFHDFARVLPDPYRDAIADHPEADVRSDVLGERDQSLGTELPDPITSRE